MLFIYALLDGVWKVDDSGRVKERSSRFGPGVTSISAHGTHFLLSDGECDTRCSSGCTEPFRAGRG